MALSWLTALKAVPWSDVVQAAPAIVQGARKLFAAAKDYAGAEQGKGTAGAGSAGADGASLQSLQARIAALEVEQSNSASLIRSLAEQNAGVVAALDALRARLRLLSWVAVILSIVLSGVLLAVLLGSKG